LRAETLAAAAGQRGRRAAGLPPPVGQLGTPPEVTSACHSATPQPRAPSPSTPTPPKCALYRYNYRHAANFGARGCAGTAGAAEAPAALRVGGGSCHVLGSSSVLSQVQLASPRQPPTPMISVLTVLVAPAERSSSFQRVVVPEVHVTSSGIAGSVEWHKKPQQLGDTGDSLYPERAVLLQVGPLPACSPPPQAATEWSGTTTAYGSVPSSPSCTHFLARVRPMVPVFCNFVSTTPPPPRRRHHHDHHPDLSGPRLRRAV
jgi:hypothetical protein